MDILLASNNQHKLKELETLFAPHKLHTPEEFGIEFEVEENGDTFSDNAFIKARALRKVSGHLNMPVLADDSGLLVKALPGLLGVKTARFGSENGGPVLPAAEKNALLLEMLKDRDDRSACFVTNLVIIFPDNSVLTSEGRAPGYILNEPTGQGGFGYDPVFFNTEANMPGGLMTTAQKNQFGHRGKAARLLLQQIERHLNAV